ncbi:MAG TPA: hypothetical protein VFJ97_13925 [Dermatophilaceae bacterium]|nr:hypothetical protein [Dermatophilaceae bacterium]
MNVHEDQSSVSLAIGPGAVHAVQRIPLPLTVDESDPWVFNATQRLLAAASKPSPEPKSELQRRMRRETSALSSEVRRLESEIAARLPSTLRERFSAGFDEGAFEAAPGAFPMKLVGMARLVTNARAALDALDAQPWHVLQLIGGDADLPG